MTYKDHVCGVAECVEVDEFFDFGGKTEEHRSHDIGKVAGKCLDIVAGLVLHSRRHPVVFCSLNKVVDLGIDKLENTLLGGLFVASKFLCRVQSYWSSGSGGSGRCQELLELLASNLEMTEIDENLANLSEILHAQAVDQRFAHFIAQKFIKSLGASSAHTYDDRSIHTISKVSSTISGFWKSSFVKK